MRAIVLLTDFGHKDNFVGVMKGVILSINPEASIVDLCHEVSPGNIREAAFLLKHSVSYFPKGTIFVVVVDPGVGTERRAIALSAHQHLFVGPDNGLFTPLFDSAESIVELNRTELFLPEVSTTFHARDIFAPVAAGLAKGLELAEVGDPINDPVRLSLPEPVEEEGIIKGCVVEVDLFGNLITNIREATVRRSFKAPLEGLELRVKRRKVKGIANTYAERPAGELVALIGSSAYLEVAVNQGSAAEMLGCERGDTVNLTTSSQ